MPLDRYQVAHQLTIIWRDFPADRAAKQKLYELIRWLVRRWRLDA